MPPIHLIKSDREALERLITMKRIVISIFFLGLLIVPAQAATCATGAPSHHKEYEKIMRTYAPGTQQYNLHWLLNGMAWCLHKDHNKPIRKKSMTPPSICAPLLVKFPLLSGISEHKAGQYACKAACGSTVVGGDIGMAAEELAMLFITACQCDTNYPQWLALFRKHKNYLLHVLKSWEGCSQ